jgi:hypothetical protein
VLGSCQEVRSSSSGSDVAALLTALETLQGFAFVATAMALLL